MTSRTREHRLFGGRIVVSTRSAWWRALAGALLLFGPGYAALWAGSVWGGRRPARRLERWWARACCVALGLRVELAGLEHIRPGERYIVVALHEGFADALALSRLPLELTYVARAELWGWRFLGGQLRRGRHIVASPEKPWVTSRGLVREARVAIDRGESVVVFPQGSLLGIEVAFQPGAFALARLTGRPVLPVVLSGAHRVWEYPFGGTLRFGQRVTLRVLPPVLAGRAVEQRGAIEAAMKSVALAPGAAPPRRFDPRRDGFWDGYRYEIDPAFPEVARRVAEHRQGD